MEVGDGGAAGKAARERIAQEYLKRMSGGRAVSESRLQIRREALRQVFEFLSANHAMDCVQEEVYYEQFIMKSLIEVEASILLELGHATESNLVMQRLIS